MRSTIINLLAAAGLFLVIAPAHGESYLDLYGGLGSSDVDVSVDRFDSDEMGARSESIDSPYVVGARWRRWFESNPHVGFALDLTHFKLPGDRLDMGVTSLSLLGMVRYGFQKREDYPQGRIQPYLGFGLGWFFGDIDTDLRPQIGFPTSDLGSGIGIDTRAGVSWFVAPGTALFTEFRYVDVSMENDEERCGLFACTGEVIGTTDADISARQWLAGISFRL